MYSLTIDCVLLQVTDLELFTEGGEPEEGGRQKRDEGVGCKAQREIEEQHRIPNVA